MGFCFSCCRRRSSRDEDREPLLPGPGSAQTTIQDNVVPSKTNVNKLTDVFAALQAGKLPTQDQVNSALRKLLRSDVLVVEGGKTMSAQGPQSGPLSEKGETILKDVRELIESIIQFGMEKNEGDRLQDMIYQSRKIGNKPVAVNLDASKDTGVGREVEVLENAIPSKEEVLDDADRLSSSMGTIVRLLLTSRNFRLLLSDVLSIFRELLADVAADVAQVAGTVQDKADIVEQTARPDNDDDEAKSPGSSSSSRSSRIDDPDDEDTKQMQWQDEMKKIGQETKKTLGKETKEEFERLKDDAPDRLINSMVDRLQKILVQAQKKPAYKSSLHTIIHLLGKYLEKTDSAVSAAANISSSSAVQAPVVTSNPHLTRALNSLRILLERLASGYSLSPLIYHLRKTIEQLKDTANTKFKDDLRNYLESVGAEMEQALSEPGYIASDEGRDKMRNFYNRGQELMRSNKSWSAEANKVLQELDKFIDHLKSDRTTQRIIGIVDRLSNHASDLFRTAADISIKRQRGWRQELKADLIGWVLPRALNMLRVLPMPRVEVKSKTLELVVDSVLLSAVASFLPDHAVVQNWSEVRLEGSAAAAKRSNIRLEDVTPEVHSCTRTRIHVDGVRVSAHDIGYYLNYIGPLAGWISWMDNGYMSIDIGRIDMPGEGLSVDAELETLPSDRIDHSNMIFRVNHVNVDVPGLQVRIDESRHWIFNKLIQPFAGPAVRKILGNILASQIRSILENVNQKLSDITKEANSRVETTDEGPGIEDYWDALCTTLGSSTASEESDEESAVVETATQLTLQGVVIGRRSQEHAESSSPPTPSETLVSVGVGSQILPGKGPPSPDVKPFRDVITDVEGTVMDAAGRTKAFADDAMQTAVKVRDNFEVAAEREGEREEFERRKKGWKTRAFDL